MCKVVVTLVLLSLISQLATADHDCQLNSNQRVATGLNRFATSLYQVIQIQIRIFQRSSRYHRAH
jgi:hypothetical protein